MFARTVESLPDGLNLPGEKYCAAKLTDDQLLRIINLRPRDDDNVLNIWKRIPESIEFTRGLPEAPVVLANDDLAVAYATNDYGPATGGRRGTMTQRSTAEAMREREALMDRVATLDQYIHQAPVDEIQVELEARGWTPTAPRRELDDILVELAPPDWTPPTPRAGVLVRGRGRGGSRGGGTKRKTKRVRRKTKRKSKKRKTRRK